jgi:hypothetical protein
MDKVRRWACEWCGRKVTISTVKVVIPMSFAMTEILADRNIGRIIEHTQQHLISIYESQIHHKIFTIADHLLKLRSNQATFWLRTRSQDDDGSVVTKH